MKQKQKQKKNNITSTIILNDKNYNILFNKPYIDTIIINNQRINSKDIDLINQQKNIRTINFNFCSIDSVAFSPQLTHLIFAYSSIDFSLLNALENLLELEIVNDEEDEIEINTNDLLKFKNLEIIRIYNSRIRNAEKFNNFRNLKELYLDGSLVDTKHFFQKINKSIKISYRNTYMFD